MLFFIYAIFCVIGTKHACNKNYESQFGYVFLTCCSSGCEEVTSTGC